MATRIVDISDRNLNNHSNQDVQPETGSHMPEESNEKKTDLVSDWQDAFGNEEFAEGKYKILKWW